VGTESPEDLITLQEYLADIEVFDLRVWVISSDQAINLQVEKPTMTSHHWLGDAASFVQSALTAGVPRISDLPTWAIRVGTTSVNLGAGDVQHVLERFALVTERDLLEPDSSLATTY